MSHGCTLETGDGPLGPAEEAPDAQREITAASGELSRRWRSPAATADPVDPAMPRVSAVETVRTRGYAAREMFVRAAGAPLSWPPHRVRLLVLALFITVIVACGVIAVAAWALPVP